MVCHGVIEVLCALNQLLNLQLHWDLLPPLVWLKGGALHCSDPFNYESFDHQTHMHFVIMFTCTWSNAYKTVSRDSQESGGESSKREI